MSKTGAYTTVVGVKEPYAQAQFRVGGDAECSAVHFQAVVHRSTTDHFTVGGVDRVDLYGNRSHCVRGELAPLCDCKK